MQKFFCQKGCGRRGRQHCHQALLGVLAPPCQTLRTYVEGTNPILSPVWRGIGEVAVFGDWQMDACRDAHIRETRRPCTCHQRPWPRTSHPSLLPRPRGARPPSSSTVIDSHGHQSKRKGETSTSRRGGALRHTSLSLSALKS